MLPLLQGVGCTPPQQGMKEEKQNTKLELGLGKLAMKDIVNRLRNALVVCHSNMAQYKWRNRMCKIDTLMFKKTYID